MNEQQIEAIVKRGMEAFGKEADRHSEALLTRILNEVDFGHGSEPRELRDTDLDMLAAAGDLSGLLGDDDSTNTAFPKDK